MRFDNLEVKFCYFSLLFNGQSDLSKNLIIGNTNRAIRAFYCTFKVPQKAIKQRIIKLPFRFFQKLINSIDKID